MMKGLEEKNFYIPIIPYWWHLIASPLAGKAHAVGCQIWFVYRVTHNKQPIKLSRQWFSLMKISRWAVQRALLELEKAGLIVVKKGKGKAPLITIILDKSQVSVSHNECLEKECH